MAGDFAIAAPFTRADMDALSGARLGVTVLIDLSHNTFTTTTAHPGAIHFSSKPVALDIQIARGTASAQDFFGLGKLKSTSAAFQIYKWIADNGGLARLLKSNVKIEAPHFDPSIVEHGNGALAAPLKAATASNAAEFMQLSESIRKSMGIYRWDPVSNSYALSGSAASVARTAP